jgi:rubrerythrin
MMSWLGRRWLDVVTAIYIYNEHRGYTALDKVLLAVRRHFPDDHELIADIEQHRTDERKHYLMFRRWFEKRGEMPLFIDRACGHIDRFVEIVFRKRIDDLDIDRFIAEGHFEELCRVISLTEHRGYRQLEVLLRHPLVRKDRTLHKIFQVIKQDEPRHWAPYDRWIDLHGGRDPSWWERAVDAFIHSELLLLKLPILFLAPGLERRTRWPDEEDAIEAPPLPKIAAAPAPPELAEAGVP